jgi:5-methylcytosine-specific restriction endonuclease McrA
VTRSINPYGSTLYQRNRRLVLEAAGFRCEWPGCLNAATTADHIIPLDQGGSHAISNLRASCLACNSRGGAAITNERRRGRRMGRLSREW